MPIFTFSFSTSTRIKVKIAIKINPYYIKKIDVVCVQYSLSQLFFCVLLFLLLRNPVEEAELNNRNADTLQILQEDKVS